MPFEQFVGHALTHAVAESIGCVGEVMGYAVASSWPYKLPSLEEMIHAHQRGWMTNYQLTENAKVHCVSIEPSFDATTGTSGYYPNGPTDLWNRVYFSKQELPTIHEYFAISNRQQTSDPEVELSLKSWGFIGDRTRKDLANLRYEIPGPSDMVRFSVRHVFEPELIQKLGYDDEYNPALDVWHQFQGLNYEIWSGPMVDFVNKFEDDHNLPANYFANLYAQWDVEEPTWARAYWWSHWVLPSPTQGYLMWQRLNPQRDKTYDGPEMQGLNFDYSDLELLLRANDYPPLYRPYLAAISRPIPGIRFAREFRRNGVYDFNDLLNWAQRQGFAEADAFDIAQDIETWAQNQKTAKQREQGKAQLKQAFDAGIIDLNSLVQQAELWGMDTNDATIFGQVVGLDHQVHRAKGIITAVRRQFLAGKVSNQQAQNLLNQAGVLGPAIQDYLHDWALELATNTKQISASKSIQWACKNLISIPELTQRLLNLDYDPVDVRIMIQEALACQLTLSHRAAAQVSRQQAAQHKASVAAQRVACDQFKAARRALASHGSPAQLRKWFCEGALGAPELYDRLRFLGWDDIDIARLISDCKSGRPGPVAPPGPGPLQTGGPPPPSFPCPPGP